jgi:hypothetical protein
MKLAIGVAAVGVVLLGVFPNLLLEVTERSAASLMPLAPAFFGMQAP